MELKTSVVAKRLGVSAKTIQRWVKKYDIPCEKNEAGHYVFDEQAVTKLEKIKFLGVDEQENEQVEQIEKIHGRLNQLEQKIDQKADDVVSFQLLQHRKEMEEMLQQLQQLEQRLANLEQQKTVHIPQEEPKKAKRRGIISLFI
jgi:chromosome-anchoring protein RacA